MKCDVCGADSGERKITFQTVNEIQLAFLQDYIAPISAKTTDAKRDKRLGDIAWKAARRVAEELGWMKPKRKYGINICEVCFLMKKEMLGK